MPLDLSGLTPLDTSGLAALDRDSPGIDVSGLQPLDTSGLEQMDAARESGPITDELPVLEGEAPVSPGGTRAIGEFGAALAETPRQIIGAAASAYRAGEGLEKDTLVNDLIAWSKKGSDELMRRNGAGDENDVFASFPGIGDITYKDVRQLPQNLGFSITSAIAGLGVGVPISLIPAPGTTAAGWAAGTGASGVAAYRMAKDQIVSDVREVLNQRSIETTGAPVSDKDWRRVREDIEDAAQRYGLWEAVPEALSNATGLKIIRMPIAKFMDLPGMRNVLARGTAKFAGVMGVELGTETITQVGQGGIEAELGLREKAPTVAEAFKEVAPQTVLLTSVMGPAAAGGSKAYDILTAPKPKGEREKAAATQPEITPDDDASPIPNDLIAEGKAIIQDAQASQRASEILARNGFPEIDARVTVTWPDGRTQTGVVADGFAASSTELGIAAEGIKINLDRGGTFEEFFPTIRQSGVTVAPAAKRAASPKPPPVEPVSTPSPVSPPSAPAPQAPAAPPVAVEPTPPAVVGESRARPGAPSPIDTSGLIPATIEEPGDAQKDQRRLPSEVGIRTEPEQTQPEPEASPEAPARGRGVQADEGQADGIAAPVATYAEPERPDGIFVQIGNRRYEVASLAEASRRFVTARNRSNLGSSELPSPLIVDGAGNVIGYISYNGRIWAGTQDDWKPGDKPIYDNRDEEARTAALVPAPRSDLAEPTTYKGIPIDKPAKDLTDEELAVLVARDPTEFKRRNAELAKYDSDSRFFVPVVNEKGQRIGAFGMAAWEIDWKLVRDYLRDGTLNERGQRIEAMRKSLIDKAAKRGVDISTTAGLKTVSRILSAAETGRYNDMLHPSNVSSREIFAEITGVKLPKTLRDTKALFDGKPFLTEDGKRLKAPEQAAEPEPQRKLKEKIAAKRAEKVEAPPGYSLDEAQEVPDPEEARMRGGKYSAVARRHTPWAVEKGYGDTPEAAQRDALRRFEDRAKVPPASERAEFERILKLRNDAAVERTGEHYRVRRAQQGNWIVQRFMIDAPQQMRELRGDENWTRTQAIEAAVSDAFPSEPARTAPSEPTTKTPESAIIPAKEDSDGVQDTLPSRDAGAGAEDVPGVPAERDARRPPSGEIGRSAPLVRGIDEVRSETSERIPPRPVGEGSRGASPGDVDRVSERERGQRAARPDSRVTGENFQIEIGTLEEGRGWPQKARDNIRAIELTRQIEAEGRPATKAEQEQLALYVGWGGIKGAFPDADGKFSKGFEETGRRLQELLSETEYATARRSIQYAHYTSENVIRAMWKAAERLGFKGGKVFEPGMGIGHFAGLMPSGLAHDTTYNGLELDHTTVRIARLLYPKWGIRQDDFTRAPVPKDTYDLAIGNPPFADVPIKSDPEYAKHSFLLHDYFFAKSLDAVRPGGLLMFISSAGTMNKLDTKAREYLAERADLVGAIRLPSSAFARNAGTEVTTDIIILRKRLPGEAAKDTAWTETTEITLPDKEGKSVTGAINRYFAEHPEMVLGEQGFFDKLYQGRYAVRPIEGRDLRQDLDAAIERLPSGVMAEWVDTAETRETDFAASERKEGTYYHAKDGRLMQMRGGVGVPVQARGKDMKGGKSAAEFERIQGLIPIRDALRAVYAADLNEDGENAAKARERLNTTYDAFVAKYGPINKADIQHRRPNAIQQESARAEAREEARYTGQAWDEGSFDPAPLLAKGAKLAEIARARREAREAAARDGKAWDEGSFSPDDMEDVVIDRRPNIDPFMDDPESYRLRSIEKYDDETGKAKKGAVFEENVIKRDRPPEIKSINDALLHTLNRKGRLDLAEISHLAGISESEAIEQLGEQIFQVPGAPGTWETRDAYLSGNVRKKLAEAKAAAERNPEFQRNVLALESAQPEPLPPSAIGAHLGMPWIPTEVIEEFGVSLGLERLKVNYTPALALWVVQGDQSSAAATTTWGTADRSAPALIQDALNRQDPKIYDTIREDGRDKRVLNETATQAAQDKVREIKERFSDWIWSDPARADRLAQIYNENYNNLVVREYDGSYLTTPGVSTAWRWRPHQTRVIARVIQTGNTYMAHAVGAGKTSAMIGAGMEMRRLGLVRKPMYAVPNHMLGQFAKEFYEQYPTAKIAIADERRFHTDRRKQFIADVANEDLDAVIITHSAFGLIPMSREFRDGLIQDQIDEYRNLLEDIGKGNDSETRITRLRLEQAVERLEQRLEGKGKRQDETFTFEEMGVDFLFIDEAHMFRKLDFATKMGNVKGISPEGSKAAFDLYTKTRYLETVNPGRNLVLASGTPITNTMAELYTVSRYLQTAELHSRSLGHFDAWAGAFGDTVTQLEQNAAGGYQTVTRFAKFVNVPELSAMTRQVMDVVTNRQLGEYVTRPKLKGGKRKMNLAEKTEELDAYQRTLAQRMREIAARKRPPQPGDDIMLRVINDGRHAAIDMRLVDPAMQNDPRSKLNLLIDNVHRIWKESARQPFHRPAEKGYEEKPFDYGPATQMIFSNLGVGDAREFSVHGYIVSELNRRGIPRSQIARIADYKTHTAKQRLFNDMNEGKVRVLIGSTQKMATGVNAQRRLLALHNLDPLWFPADDEQRNGRGLRQGNLNPEIEINDYSTKGTYDSTMWGLMETKARFIEGFFNGDASLREIEDLGEASQYEQAKAITTNDPRLIRLTELKQELEKERRRRDAFDREQYAVRRKVADAQQDILNAEKRIANVEEDIGQRLDTTGDAFTAKVGTTTYTERAEFGKAVLAQLNKLAEEQKPIKKKIGELGGFELRGDAYKAFSEKEAWGASLVFLRSGKRETEVHVSGSAVGLAQSAENVLRNFETEIERAKATIAQARKVIADFTPKMGQTYGRGEEITKLSGQVLALERDLAAESQAAQAQAQAQAAAQETEDGDERFSLPRSGPGVERPFYSALTRGVESIKLEKAPPGQWRGVINNLTQKGVKQEEIDWSGVQPWLDSQLRPVTKADVVAFLRENEVKVEEVVKGGKRADVDVRENIEGGWSVYDMDTDERVSPRFDTREEALEEAENSDKKVKDTKFSSYQLPGGENYRELLLTLPFDKNPEAEARRIIGEEAWARMSRFTRQELIDSQTNPALRGTFRGGHFDEPNVLAHIRFNERTDAEGKRVLFIEEIQSDWHQKGRKLGYAQTGEITDADVIEFHDISQETWGNATKSERDDMRREAKRLGASKGVPDAPFKQSWQELAFKRALRWAAENDFDKIAWTTGEQQAERYDLSKKISSVVLQDNSSGGVGRPNMEGPFQGGALQARDHSRTIVIDRYIKDQGELADAIGKDLADKLLKAPAEAVMSAGGTGVRSRRLSGLDLKVGGEGMKGFYDKILPAFANKYAKKWGAKVEASDIGDNVAIINRIGNEVWSGARADLPDLEKGDRIISRGSVHSLPITPAMRESVMQGQPMFALGRGLRAIPADRIDGIERALADRLKQAGLQDRIALRVVEAIRGKGGQASAAEGRYINRTIEVALTSEDPNWTLDHEAVHALLDLGVVRPAEWTTLKKAALADETRMAEIRRRYSERKLSEESLIEEAVADMYADWAAGRTQAGGFLKTAFERIRAFFKALAASLRGAGYTTVEDIFGGIERGYVGRREGERTSTTAAAEEQFAKARDATANPDREPVTTDFPIGAKGDVVAGDTIRFEEGVFGGSFRNPSFLGNRIIEAEVMRDSYGIDKQQHTFTLRVLKSEGTDALEPGTVTRRKGRNVYRNGTWRQQWKNEDARLGVATEKHERGDAARAAREIRKSEDEGKFSVPRPPRPQAAADAVRFDSAETESRWQEARKGAADPETLVSRAKGWFETIAHGFARHYITLPNTRRFADVKEQLRKLEAAPQASKERVVRVLRNMTEGMTPGDLDVFTRKVVLDDLAWEASQERELPFGFTPEDVAREKAKVDEIIGRRPDLEHAVRQRKLIVRQAADELVNAGVLHRERVKNPAYYRHQVLDYARAQVQYAKTPGKRLKAPHWARRMGSTLDINANLLEAEFEWLQKAFTDVATAKTIKWIKDSEHNVRADVIASARDHNKRMIDRLLEEEGDGGPLHEQVKGFRQRIAIGLGKVREALDNGQVDVPEEFERAAGGLFSEGGSEADIFPFLAWILDTDQPGASGAAQVFKAISERREWTKRLLGDRYADPMDVGSLVKRFAPQGYVVWQPDEGKLLFTAKTLPEHVVDRMLERIAEAQDGPMSAREVKAALDSLRGLLAVGGNKYEMVIPEELATTLNSLRDERIDDLISHVIEGPLRWWKRWVLINPRRVIKYNLNNLSGDLDAVIAGNPKALRRMGQAIKELHHVMLRGEAPSERYREAVERGVFDSGLSIQEIPDINVMSEFEGLVQKEPAVKRFTLGPLMKVWRGLQRYTQFRENWLRYAAYLDYVDRLEAGERMESIGYGAANPEMVDAVTDPKDRAALLARELVGDYGNVSHFGQHIRRKLIPFWSWVEINTKRYWRLGSNAWGQGIGKGFRTTGILGASLGIRTSAYLFLRMAVLYALVQLWNNLLFGDDEDEMDVEARTRLHLNLGRTKDGEIRTLRFQGALSDFVGWVGMDDVVALMVEIGKGRASAGEALEAMAKAPINRIASGLTPVLKTPIEILTGQSFWPDVFRPMPIRDEWRHAFRTFSMEHEYDLIFDRPSRGYARSLREAVVSERDVGENAYNRSRSMAFDWLRREKGQEGVSSITTPRANALYEWRLALKYGDREAAERARDRLAELGVKRDDIAESIKRAHPLGAIPIKDRGRFLATLTDRERDMLDQATDWYRSTFAP